MNMERVQITIPYFKQQEWLKADPQYKTSDKVEPKADKKAKANGAASLVSVETDLNSLEKVWSETASEMKAMQRHTRT